jgi:hypothetical protein
LGRHASPYTFFQCPQSPNLTANSIFLYSTSWLVLWWSLVMLWALSPRSRDAAACCFLTLNFATGQGYRVSNLGGQGTLGHLLGMRQGRHLPSSQPFEWWPLSSRRTAAVAKDLRQNWSPSLFFDHHGWLRPEFPPDSFKRFAHDCPSHSRNSCSFVELNPPARSGVGCVLKDHEVSVILVFTDCFCSFL